MAEALSDYESELDPQTPPLLTRLLPSLSQETLIALMTMKINCWECCYESTFTKKLQKKANSKAVKPINDIIKVGVVSGCGMCPQSHAIRKSWHLWRSVH